MSIAVLDETSLLDIKPDVPDLGSRPDARAGWHERRPTGKEGRS